MRRAVYPSVSEFSKGSLGSLIVLCVFRFSTLSPFPLFLRVVPVLWSDAEPELVYPMMILVALRKFESSALFILVFVLLLICNGQEQCLGLYANEGKVKLMILVLQGP